MFAPGFLIRAERLVALYRARGLKLVTAESCTGGLIAALITEIPGSSNVLERGYVTYSNRAKDEDLGVPSSLIEKFGAVSREVAQAMAEGALVHSPAEIAISVTGIAGPDGGSAAKPVGLVYFGCGRAGAIKLLEKRFGSAGRAAIRSAAVETALDLLFAAAP
ncbi:MAG TPA: CinA family protein [Methylovirgula sp.]|nr:CinA family protein [Methylovirgula sp.]